VAAALVILVASLGWLTLFPPGVQFVRIEAPAPGEVVGPGGVEVMVRFPEPGQVASETLRVLLNGADVTATFAVGENGAYGHLHSLLDGKNMIQIEVFGHVPWFSSVLVEERQDLPVVLRRRLDLHQG
jgi:hypothetical protein